MTQNEMKYVIRSILLKFEIFAVNYPRTPSMIVSWYNFWIDKVLTYNEPEKYYLKSHIAAKHDGERFQCKKCDYQCAIKHYLKSHIASKHDGGRFQCERCDFQLIYDSSH